MRKTIAMERMRKRDQAYVFLQAQLLEQQIKPGEMLDVEAIARTLGMSRTPVLEAVSLLEREGFVSVVPQVGVFVRAASSRDVYERVVARAALEGVLAEHAARRVDAATIASLRTLAAEMEIPTVSAVDYARLNREFHRLIHRAAEMPTVEELVDNLWNYLNYLGYADQLFRDRHASAQQHRQILSALEARDPQAARTAMELHVRRVAELFAPVEGAEEQSQSQLSLTRPVRRPRRTR